MKLTFYADKKYQDLLPNPYQSSKKIPEWYKKTENLSKSKCPLISSFENIQDVVKKSNIKTCPAVIDFLNSGYIIPAWTNFLFREVNGDFYINWEHSFMSHYDKHSKDLQFDGMSVENSPQYNSFHKVTSPWAIKTSPGVSCLITHPFWEREKRFTTASGIVHSDISPIPIKWFFEVNMNLKSTQNQIDNFDNEFIIKKGSPLIQIIPFVRKKINSEIKYIDEQEYISQIILKSLYATNDWFNKSIYNNFRESLGKLFK